MRIMATNFGDRPAFHHQLNTWRYKVSAHIHQYAELVFVLEGRTKITVDGKEEWLEAGDAAFVFPFQVHSFTSRDENKIAMYLFSPAALLDLLSAHDGKVGDSAKFQPSALTLSSLNERILGKEEPKIYDIKAFLYLSLTDYLESATLKESVLGNDVVSKVITHLHYHFKDEVSLETVGRDLGYSANYLSHCIKRLYGMNFCSVLAAIRVEHARRLLSQTDNSLTEISFECGFGSLRSFLRQFKANTGFTPSEYRGRFFTGAKPEPKIIYW